MMLGNNIFKLCTEEYQKFINTFCAACSYDLNSRGIKLLDEAASAVTLAIDKLSELEKFIAESKAQTFSKEESLNEPKNIEENLDIVPPNHRTGLFANNFYGDFTVYFSINENVAENHVAEALNEAGIFNFVVDKLINRINFAYGFISFTDHEAYKRITSPHKIYVGNSLLKVIPKRGVLYKGVPKSNREEKRNRNCRRRKLKTKKLSKSYKKSSMKKREFNEK